MNHIKILDCTLRDGAYLVDKYFGNRIIHGIADGLNTAGVDIIELGFLQNEGFGEGNVVFKDTTEAEKFIPQNRNRAKFTLFADYSRYDANHLSKRKEGGIDAIRECFKKQERIAAMKVCSDISEKGYEVFVQPVDILGYSDKELIELIEVANSLEITCFSIVDTFGSMYVEDLRRLYELLDYNLISTISLGFHSHNNMQLSSALSQELVRMAAGKRNIVIDSTMSGMGRGAGNTPTELIAQYLNKKNSATYDIDELLDIIDIYIDYLRTRCEWGYKTEFFVAGSYGAHVNNIKYLKDKNSIKSKDMRYILNSLGQEKRKQYDYDYLEEKYVELLDADIDDHDVKKVIKDKIKNKPVLVLALGNSIKKEKEKIDIWITKYSPYVISVNHLPDEFDVDAVWVSNLRRYPLLLDNKQFNNVDKIITSNIKGNHVDNNTYTVSFVKYVKCGWDYMDNSTLMLLRFLCDIDVTDIGVAGLDGFSADISSENYINDDFELESSTKNAQHMNREISEMLRDFMVTKGRKMKLNFVTTSRFENILNEYHEQ